jgi:peptidoglycan/xylan/chitin deacetylase (PgdA/CDA1 family)
VEVNSRKGKANQFLILLNGLAILILAFLIYFLIMRNVFGNFSTSSILPDFKALTDYFSGKKPAVGVLYSTYTENMLPQGSTWMSDNISAWKKQLNSTGVSYEIINDEVIETEKHYDYKIIILPGSRSLSDREIVNLKKFLDNGGSVFATSGTASYARDGKWRGWEFFSEVFGVKFSKEITKDENRIHTLRGGLPITANLPTGYPLKLASWDNPIAVEVLDPRTKQVSFWYNYRLQKGLVREEIKKTAGIVYGNYGKGRFVWMGFEPTSVIGVQEDYVQFDKLFRNCINWLSYVPIGFMREWPEGYDAAAVIAPAFSANVGNIDNMMDILASEKIKATFFIDEETGVRNKNLLRAVSSVGEVAALVDIGYLRSINDTLNSLNDQETQTKKIQRIKAAFENLTKKPVTGLLPYNGLFDANTVKSLMAAGYNYVLTDSLTDRSVPKTLIFKDNRILSMTKTARDDYEIIRDFGLAEPEFQYYTYQEDIDRILFEGGMYVLKLHNDFQLRSENYAVVKEIVRDLKRKNFWIATADEISRWSENRSYADIRVEKRGESRVVVRISNPGVSPLLKSVVQVEISEHAEDLALNSEIIGTTPAAFDYDKTTNTVLLHINDLKPGESRIYYLDYTKRNI